ncbi:MAG: hypothetical protein H6945_14730 [Zoogloeaceae bacterium]|nr:hypothetical protein [Rhodocyclaceae bacterium]MCP5236988.1 hypothetical protein [Zoogloeaceae bacterium]
MWLATSCDVWLRLRLTDGDAIVATCASATAGTSIRHLSVGEHLHYYLLDLSFEQALPEGRWVGYELEPASSSDAEPRWQGWREWAPDLCYPGRQGPGFIRRSRIRSLRHGSRRKPHHDGGDGLAAADRLRARSLRPDDDDTTPRPVWPALLLLTGDQVYVVDVCGPMLRAIHDLLDRLELANEGLAGSDDADVRDTDSLYRHPCCYCHRERLLPRRKRNFAVLEILFGGVEKPVFTADNAHNHLITPGEMLAMYPLAWSPAAWHDVMPDAPAGLDDADLRRYRQEASVLEGFVADLGRVRRVMAHGRRLLNGSGIGLVELDDEGRPWRIRELLANGGQCEFTRREDEWRWH